MSTKSNEDDGISRQRGRVRKVRAGTARLVQPWGQTVTLSIRLALPKERAVMASCRAKSVFNTLVPFTM